MNRDPSALLSVDRSLDSLGELTDEQRLRLTDVLDRWLVALEQGTPLAQEQLLAQHPDLAETLRTYFHSLADLHEMAAGFGSGGASEDAGDDALEADEKRIGDFELGRELGRGGMGVVYEARQISLNRQVAVKILPFAAVLDSRQIARFKHEAQAAAQLHHPNIVPVFAIGVERGVHYYAMQLVNGQSLDEYVASLQEQHTKKRGKRLSREHFETVARLGLQAAEALHAAHEYGVVHRDVKPSNLLLETTGSGPKLWVTDFGLARMQREVSLTRTGDLVGTLRYMSPEQARGNSALVDQRTDIYSLGATLYELATLAPAYRDDNTAVVLRQIETEDPASPQQLRPEMPADLANIISTAMSRQRDDRYATAADFAADFRRFLAGEPTVARAPSLLERVSRWSRRHTRLIASAATLLLVAVIGLAIGAFLIAREAQRANAYAVAAQQSARDAREVLDRFGRQLSERLAQVAGAEQVRRDLLLDASDYYRRFIETAQDDPAQQAELAVAYGRLASLLDDVGTPEESLAAHEQAVQFLNQLAEQQPTTENRQQLAVARNNLAMSYHRSGKAAPAREQLNQAIEALQALAAAEPRNEQFASDLATSYGNLGLVQQAAGETTAAEASFLAASERLQKLLGSAKNSVSYQRKLAANYNNLAGLHAQQNPQHAIELHQQAQQLQEAAAKVDAVDLDVQRELGLTHQNLGAAYAKLQRHLHAAEEYERASAIQSELVQASPAQQSFRRDLAVSHNNCGLAYTRMKQPAPAIQEFQQAADLHRHLVSMSREDAALHSSLGSTLSNLGVAFTQTADVDSAKKSFAEAIAAQQLAVQFAPENKRYQALLAKHEALLAALVQNSPTDHTQEQPAVAQPRRPEVIE